jgi:hypothetical protein
VRSSAFTGGQPQTAFGETTVNEVTILSPTLTRRVVWTVPLPTARSAGS